MKELLRWIYGRTKATGTPPEFIPISREELGSIISDNDFVRPTEQPGNFYAPSTLYGKQIFETPYAEVMRERSLDLSYITFEETLNTFPINGNVEKQVASIEGQLHVSLWARVCKDDTRITVTLPWDPWFWLKKLLHITKWFPPKSKKIEIKGTVLYPYLKISLPANRHHVRLKVESTK